MTVGILVLSAAALAAQSPARPVPRPSNVSACSLVSADALTDTAVGEICQGDDAARSRQWRTAADHYRRAATLSPKVATKVAALDALVTMYDDQHLNEPREIEGALREIVRLTPDNPATVYRLAQWQEDQGDFDAAEDTLLVARRQQPDASEPFRTLAAFYSRRAAAIQRARQAGASQAEPGERPVRVGGGVLAPTKVVDVRPVYPQEAQAAGVQGVVIIELTVNEAGNATNPTILRSIPLLDDAALEAVRQWRFTPTRLNGQPVPVIMTATVNFTLPDAAKKDR